MDGPFHPEHAGTRIRAYPPRLHLRGLDCEVRRALLLYRLRHEPARYRRHVGRGGRFLLRPAAPPGWQREAAEGALDRRPASPLRHHDRRGEFAGARPGSNGADPRTPTADTRTQENHAPHGTGALWGRGARDYGPRQPRAAPPDPYQDA